MASLKSQEELYDEFITELQNIAPELTDTNEGSNLDFLAGVMSFAVSEISRLTVDEFRKTFFDTAHGPEITGGPDDLETLAVDHFGDDFARPAATSALGVVAFSRANMDAGNCTIPIGTVVKTLPNANGEAQRFTTEAEVILTGLTINASVNAAVPGVAGNVLADTVTVIESALTDSSVVVTNALAFTGGAAEENDAEYRETIRNRLLSLTGATLAAITAAAKNVAGVETATAIEAEIVVIEYDIATSAPVVGADYFRIPRVILYIADANGTASAPLIALVEAAIAIVRAAGVRVEVLGAIALELDWSAEITLNPGGPNFAELSVDPTPIEASMRDYINELPIGTDFIRTTANAAIMAIWGPAGTNDITAFVTNTPSGNVPAAADEKLIPDDIEVA